MVDGLFTTPVYSRRRGRLEERGTRVKDRAKNGPSFIFWFSFNFSRDQNRKSPSTVSFCSETKRKRLLRRLVTTQTSIFLGYIIDFTYTTIFIDMFAPKWPRGPHNVFPSWDPCITPGYRAWYLNAFPTSG